MGEKLTRPRVVAVVFGLFLLNGLLLTLYNHLKSELYGTNTGFGKIAINELGGSVAAACLLTFFLYLMVDRKLVTASSNSGWVAVHAIAILIYSFLHTSAHLAIRNTLYPLLGYGEYDPVNIPLRYAMELPNDVVTYAKWLLLFIAFEYYRRLRDREVASSALEHSLMEARLKNLQTQMQPHFLMNSLNAISSLIYSNPQAADEMIARLGAFLRRLLSDEDGKQVPLSYEIESVQAYISIMQMRYKERLRYRFDIDPAVSSAQVPPLILQPLVENSIVHGADPADFSVEIDVTARRQGDRVEVAVRDHGPGVRPNARTGVGLQNLRKRMATLYGDKQSVDIENAAGGGTIVRLLIPQNV